MIIHFDVDGYQGVVPYGVHQFDTADPNVQTMMAALSGNPAAQAKAGYAVVHKVAGRPVGETRWQFILDSVSQLPADDPVRKLNPH